MLICPLTNSCFEYSTQADLRVIVRPIRKELFKDGRFPSLDDTSYLSPVRVTFLLDEFLG